MVEPEDVDGLVALDAPRRRASEGELAAVLDAGTAVARDHSYEALADRAGARCSTAFVALPGT